MRPSPSPLRRALLRAGAGGALAGGDPGAPHLGLVVPVRTPDELAAVVDTGIRVTLLISPALARLAPEVVRAAAKLGHEIAGLGAPEGIAALEVAAGRPVTLWSAKAPPASPARLAALGLTPLPLPLPTPEPGGTWQLPPADLAAEVPRLRALGYRPGPVGELPGLRRARGRDLGLHLYRRAVDDRFARAHRVRALTERADGVLRVSRQPAPPELGWPTGAAVAELHVHSPRLVGLSARSPLTAYRAFARSLRDVAAVLRDDPEFSEVAGVVAVTLFHEPLAAQGFQTQRLPPLRARLYGLGFRLMRRVYGTAVPTSEPEPRLAWMERAAFLARHG
ncbi:Sectered polysaccharide deacetylase [Deinococcus sp. SDU3-2]|uniref:Sectered polysaccharide deacetylase n=1 Tax=Deinococcus terrestris TaxID=2651870 RepID=A0A7X1NUN2_9DEIO|nr:Sectered polysaccharide deacetylase [Deinococcus terrestris]MPY66121.1 Sectered polysaccharide deacetylase [Deinococcus terrestris]